MEQPSSLSSVCVHFIVVTVLGLKQVLNLFAGCNVYFIMQIYILWLGHHKIYPFSLIVNTHIVSSPLLLRYDSSKPVFLKTDWPANGMGYILMQPDNYSESIRTLAILEESGDCTFELSLKGPRLHPVLFGSRSNLPYDMHHHSFVGEIACGRWSIAHNRRYLWGK